MPEVPVKPLFEFRNVTVSFSGRAILKRLDWKLEPSQVAVILGPSGSGKSVFLSTLLGFIEPDEGVVMRPGGPDGGLFREVSVLFQEDALLDDRTVEANLAIALFERADVFGGPFDPETSRRIDAALTDVSLEPARVRRQLPSSLSGGMRRRVALARALIREPRVLLADEPTSGLDPQTAESIYTLMKRLIDSRGMSAVMITHDPLCARTLGNPALSFTPLEGSLRPWEPGSRLDQAEAASEPAEAGEGEGDASFLNPSHLLGSFLDRIGENVLLFRLLAVPPSIGLLREGLIQWGVRSAGLVALIFFISGFVVQVQAERAVVDLGFSNRIPELFALALTRTAPILVGVLMAGRCGSAVSAQTGWRVFSSQYRALTTLGVDPDRSFFPALVWSWILSAPLLMMLGLVSALASALLFLASPLSAAQITPTFFLNDFPATITFQTVVSMLAKSVLMAGGTAAIAYRYGAGAKRSSHDVMQGMTWALVASFVWLAVVDLVLGLLVRG